MYLTVSFLIVILSLLHVRLCIPALLIVLIFSSFYPQAPPLTFTIISSPLSAYSLIILHLILSLLLPPLPPPPRPAQYRVGVWETGLTCWLLSLAPERSLSTARIKIVTSGINNRSIHIVVFIALLPPISPCTVASGLGVNIIKMHSLRRGIEIAINILLKQLHLGYTWPPNGCHSTQLPPNPRRNTQAFPPT